MAITRKVDTDVYCDICGNECQSFCDFTGM